MRCLITNQNKMLMITDLMDIIKEKMIRLSDGRHSCAECEYIANYSSNLFSHIEANHMHQRETMLAIYTCQICAKPHGTKNALRKHTKRQHKTESDNAYNWAVVGPSDPSVN